MILYVMRHAEAVDGSDVLQDEWRYLTEKGRSAAEKMSSAIAKTGPKPRLTMASPLTRAVQTAEIIAERACRKNVVVASEMLMPGGDMGELITHLKSFKNAARIMLVGHEPQLGTLVASLLDCREDVVALKKGACVALKLSLDKPAVFLWYLIPGKKRITSFKKAFTR